MRKRRTIQPIGLTFNNLRAATHARTPRFRTRQGKLANTQDWSLNDWMVGAVGELGEAANILKKIRRGDMTLKQARPKLVQEFADVVIYLDILAAKAGIDLGDAVIKTFNNKSKLVKSKVRLAA